MSNEKKTLYEKLTALNAKRWDAVQIAAGVAAGAVVDALLFFGGEDNSTGFLAAAAVIALVLPRLVEGQLDRDVQKGRIAIMATIIVGVIAFAVKAMIK